MYFLDGHTVLRVEEKKREGVQTNETETTIRVIACYCWREDGHLIQSLLFLDFFLVAVISLLVLLVGLCHFYAQL